MLTLDNESVSAPLSRMQPHSSSAALRTHAVVMQAPESIGLRELCLDAPDAADVIVDMEWSGISTGTERLLWSGRMPAFPGMGYPLVPGYEGVGRVIDAGESAAVPVGTRVFVPGARCFGEVRGLFGSAAGRVVVPARRVLPIREDLGAHGILLALAATAWHALRRCRHTPQLIVGHGTLGRLLARLCSLQADAPVTVWETNSARRNGAHGYRLMTAAEDPRRDYSSVCDVSGDPGALDTCIERLAPGGEIVLAGFYPERVSFGFPAAFMREARLLVAAQWDADDLSQVKRLCESGALSLDGLITHTMPATDAAAAYHTAFTDPQCLKMCLEWRTGP